MDTTRSSAEAAGRTSHARFAHQLMVAAAGAAAAAWTTVLTQTAPSVPAGSGMAPAAGIFPALSPARRLSALWSGELPASIAATGPAVLALAALAVALFVWARRYGSARGGVFLLLAATLPLLLTPAVASAIVEFPQLAVSFLAGTLALAALGRQTRAPTDLGLFAGALCLVGAWLIDDLFWAALPGCLLFLLARSPDAVRARSATSLAVVVLFPVAAAALSLLFVAGVYIYPETGVSFLTGYEAFAGAAGRMGVDAPSLVIVVLAVPLGLNFTLAALAPTRLPSAFAVSALPFSACLVGMSVAGADGLLAALPMVAVSALETLRVIATRTLEWAPAARPMGAGPTD